MSRVAERLPRAFARRTRVLRRATERGLCGPALLAVLTCCLSLACASAGARSGTVPSARPAISATAEGSPAPPDIELSPSSVQQGGAFAVELRSPTVVAASSRFDGRDYPMVDVDGIWLAVIGVGQPVGSVDVHAPGEFPVDVRYQTSGSRRVWSDRLFVTVTATDFPLDPILVDAGEAGLLDPALEASESRELAQAYSAFTPVQLWKGKFALPVAGKVTTAFGARRSYQGGPASGSHAGIDLAAPLGTPVHASASGRVAWTGQLPDRGNGVILDHGLGVFTGYFHLSQALVQAGQAVSAGEAIGLSGNTGLSTGPHVHWEVVVSQINVDGLLFSRLNVP